VAPGVQDVEAVATVDDSPAAVEHAQRMVKQRYGVMYTIAGFVNRLRGYGFENGVQIRVTLPAG
jgi:SLT domain-containing protein